MPTASRSCTPATGRARAMSTRSSTSRPCPTRSVCCGPCPTSSPPAPSGWCRSRAARRRSRAFRADARSRPAARSPSRSATRSSPSGARTAATRPPQRCHRAAEIAHGDAHGVRDLPATRAAAGRGTQGERGRRSSASRDLVQALPADAAAASSGAGWAPSGPSTASSFEIRSRRRSPRRRIGLREDHHDPGGDRAGWPQAGPSCSRDRT